MPSGAIEVEPSETTTYTLTAKGPGGSTNAKATVTVNTPPPPPVPPEVTSFEADPLTIEQGKDVTLRWETKNATDVEITGVGTGLGKSGHMVVSPKNSTTYKLTAKGASGAKDAEREVSVHVNPLKVAETTPPSKTTETTPTSSVPSNSSSSSATLSSNDVQSIRDTLDKFEEFYGLKDIEGIKGLWTRVPEPLLKAYKDNFGTSAQFVLKERCPGNPLLCLQTRRNGLAKKKKQQEEMTGRICPQT